MEQDLISIVVPVYRAENYIEETLDCVRAQTYTNWELLLIEDCGPDRSRQLRHRDVTWLIWMRTICGYRRSWSWSLLL